MNLFSETLIKELSNALLPAIGQTVEEAFNKAFTNSAPPFQNIVKEFLTEPESRDLLGGISRSSFHKLKRQDKFKTYHCGEGRCLYSREELISYIKTNAPLGI